MPVWDVIVRWTPESDPLLEISVIASTKTKAVEKGYESLFQAYAKRPYEVTVEKSEYQRKKRTRSELPPITDFTPTKSFVFRDKINRTNEPGTCLWCGRPLRRYGGLSSTDKAGDYADNTFCGLRCGYEFGITAAVLEFRLKPRKDED